MKTVACIAFVLALASSCANAHGGTPISKAIQLLTDLRAKIVAEGEEAQKVYDEFAEFCEDRSRALGFSIKTGKSQVKGLEASAAEETAMMGSLSTKMEKLSSNIATDESDLAAATKIRTSEATDFATSDKELMEIIDTLGRAVGILEREMQKGGASLLQLKGAGSVLQALEILVHASALSSEEGMKLNAFVQASQQSEDESLGAPDASAYEGHSGNIISTLGSLLDKAEEQLAEARKKETSAIHQFEMLKQSLEDSIKFGNKDMDAAKKALAASSETKATAEGNLGVATKDLDTDVKTLADLHRDCMLKAQNFEAATKSRSEEVKAIAYATSVLTKETGGAEEVVYSLDQTGGTAAASFAQLGRSSLMSGADLAQFEAVRLIRDLARRQHSAALAQLASRLAMVARTGMQAGQDPFAKVKGLISTMIETLEDQADSDASHKAYCDKELAETSTKKAEKEAKMEKLSIKIDQMATRSAQLKEEVAALQKSLSELGAAQAEMDKLRSKEHEDFLSNKADTEQGLEGTKLALKVLREYYASASGAHAEAKGAGSSIIGLLEVVESDLSQSLAGMAAAEDTSASSYDAETKDNEIEKASKEQDVKYKSKEATDLDKDIAEATSDNDAEQAELAAVLAYLKSLNKQCISKPETYEERKARRTAEIAGLKQALSILESEAILIQRRSRRTLRGAQASLAAA